MASVVLTDRTIIRVSGPDAEHLLQNIVTADLDTLEAGQAKPCALLTPQGKILFDFLISRDGADAFLLDCRAELAADLTRRLMLYKLRAKAEISQEKEILVGAAWDDDSPGSQTDSSASQTESTQLRDLRFSETPVWRIYANDFRPTATLADWNALRVANGVAESGPDYDLSDVFPHDVLLDQNGGVGFKKGCYVGQEVVSRMQHRGTARRRVLIASADTNLPDARTGITANGRTIGALGTVDGRDGLAIVRIDRVKDALDHETPILAGDVPLLFTIPPGAQFTFPTDAGDDA
jgi:folate-binding protein YgfZ